MVHTDQSKVITEKINKYFSTKDEYLCVVLYGSFAKGKATQQSDVDIAVLKSALLSPEEKIQIIEDLSLELN